ncbi:hypothetical protein EZV61_19170 [Corallincola luteus]|uniref:Uncharacterized protein n=1 Tax=Corallincola luteus TaxID=1775177 RepID=A0ABY2AFJ6_9GAMM|nr:hypothetical protein [Corallincola luteus]TCI01131.1 hypothetical protein EZV61_19170 [Corallincola luteus]
MRYVLWLLLGYGVILPASADVLLYDKSPTECQGFIEGYEKDKHSFSLIPANTFIDSYFLSKSNSYYVYTAYLQEPVYPCSSIAQKYIDQRLLEILTNLPVEPWNSQPFRNLKALSAHADLLNIDLLSEERWGDKFYHLEMLLLMNIDLSKAFPEAIAYKQCLQEQRRCNDKYMRDEYALHLSGLLADEKCLFWSYSCDVSFQSARLLNYQLWFPSFFSQGADIDILIVNAMAYFSSVDFERMRKNNGRIELAELIGSLELPPKSIKTILEMREVPFGERLKIYWTIFPRLSQAERRLALTSIEKQRKKEGIIGVINTDISQGFGLDVLTLMALAVDCDSEEINIKFQGVKSSLYSPFGNAEFDGGGVFNALMCTKSRQDLN